MTSHAMNTLITLIIQNMMNDKNTYKLTQDNNKIFNKPQDFNYKSEKRLQNKHYSHHSNNNRFRYNNQSRSVIRW